MVLQVQTWQLPIVFLFYFATFVYGGFPEPFDKYSGLLQLLHLKEQNCSYINWCTLKGSAQIETDRFPNSCCSSCSCDSGCFYEGNCCPDYELSKLINITVPSTLSDVITSVKTIEWRRNISNDTNVSNETVDGHLTWSMECIRLQLLTNSPYRSRGISYKVVTKCTGTEADTMIKSLCEDFSNDAHNESVALRYTPVQAETSGYVYRNIFCFRCSLENASSVVKSWRARLVTGIGYTSYFEYTYSTIDDLFNHVLRLIYDIRGKYNIIFEPPESYKPLEETGRCAVVDVKTCSDGTTFREPLIAACENYLAPVYVYNKRQRRFVVYNNIACLYCNNLLEQQSPCLGNTRADGPVNEMRLAKAIDAKADGTLDKMFDKTNNCKAGYAYDEIKSICRKVYCPMNYIISNGSCVPLFDEISGVHYAMYLDLTSEPALEQSSQQALIVQVIQNFTFGEKHIDIEELSLWATSLQLGRLIAYMVFTINESSPGVAEEFVWRLVKELKFISTNNGLPFASNLRKISKGDQLKDTLKHLAYRRVYKAVTNTGSARDVTHLTSGNFCFRIQVSPDEITRVGREFVLKTAHGGVLVEQNFLHNDESGLPLVCADKIIELPDSNIVLDDSAKEVSNERIKGTNAVSYRGVWSKDIALGIFLGVLAFLVIAVYVVRQKCVARANRSLDEELDGESAYNSENV